MIESDLLAVSRYSPAFAARSKRGTLIAALMLLHAAVLWLMIWQPAGQTQRHGRPGLSGGRLVAFDLRESADQAGSARLGGGEAGPASSLANADPTDRPVEGGVGDLPRPGSVDLGDQLAGALADDPLAGGALSDYERILHLHISRTSAGMRERLLRTGTVMLRFRVARDGSVIDAQVLHSPGARLGELALAALWRAEPLPRVPDDLAAPLEVDMPLAIRAQG